MQPTHRRAIRPSPPHQLSGLEALRLLAAFGVLVWHYQHFLFVRNVVVGYDPLRAPFHAALAPFYSYGYYGVELFWCISGFIFTWKYGRPIHERGVTFGRFLLFRFSRLYPLHLATLLAVAALNTAYLARHGYFYVYQFNDLKHLLLNLALASQWGLQDGESFNGPAWSISIEVLLYLLFFALARWIGSSRVTDTMVAGIAVAASFLLRKHADIHLQLLDGVMFFYLGAVACHIEAALRRAPAALRRAAGLSYLAVCLLATMLLYAGQVRAVWAMVVLAPSLLLACELAALELPTAIRAGCETLGNLTYASYMLHFPLQLAIVLGLGSAGVAIAPLFYSDGFFLTYIAVTFGISYLVYWHFERPAQDMIRRVGASTWRAKPHGGQPLPPRP